MKPCRWIALLAAAIAWFTTSDARAWLVRMDGNGPGGGAANAIATTADGDVIASGVFDTGYRASLRVWSTASSTAGLRRRQSGGRLLRCRLLAAATDGSACSDGSPLHDDDRAPPGATGRTTALEPCGECPRHRLASSAPSDACGRSIANGSQIAIVHPKHGTDRFVGRCERPATAKSAFGNRRHDGGARASLPSGKLVLRGAREPCRQRRPCWRSRRAGFEHRPGGARDWPTCRCAPPRQSRLERRQRTRCCRRRSPRRRLRRAAPAGRSHHLLVGLAEVTKNGA
jgi:hypothetical protein